MKFLLVLAATVAVAIAAAVDVPNIERVRQVKSKCREMYPVDDATMYQYERLGKFPNNRNLKCLVHCFYRSEGYLNDDGQANIEFALKHTPVGDTPENIKDGVQRCAKKAVYDDKCENAYALVKCYFSGNKEAGPAFETY